MIPAKTILMPMKEKHPVWKFLAKAWDSYACRLSVEAQRKVFKNSLPSEETVVGYATVRGSQEAALWLPFGSRRVQRVLPGDTPQSLQLAGIHYVVADADGLERLGKSIEQWTTEHHGVVVDQLSFETQPGQTSSDYLVRLLPDKQP